MIRYLLLSALVCTGEATCNHGPERLYTVKMKDGRTVEMCAFNEAWHYPDCIGFYDANGSEKTRFCGVQEYAFGLPTPPPPAEAPVQR